MKECRGTINRVFQISAAGVVLMHDLKLIAATKYFWDGLLTHKQTNSVEPLWKPPVLDCVYERVNACVRLCVYVCVC